MQQLAEEKKTPVIYIFSYISTARILKAVTQNMHTHTHTHSGKLSSEAQLMMCWSCMPSSGHSTKLHLPLASTGDLVLCWHSKFKTFIVIVHCR